MFNARLPAASLQRVRRSDLLSLISTLLDIGQPLRGCPSLLCYIRGPTVDFLSTFPPPAWKVSSAIFRPSGTPPIFSSSSDSSLFLTAKASKTHWTPRRTRLNPFSSIICHNPRGELRR